MFENVLVGIEGGHDALALAHQLAAPGARVTVGRGDLRALAQAQGADLIVVGSSPSGLARAVLGEGVRAPVVEAQCATAVAPPGYALGTPRLERLGVGYDGSLNSERALIVARQLAARSGAAIRALWTVPLRAVRDADPIPPHWPRAAGELVARRAKALRALPDVEGCAVYGSPRDELVRLSAEVDLLIVGSRGYGPVKRLLHTTVSGYLATHARCPVLVIPPTAKVGKLYRHRAAPARQAAFSSD